MEFNTEHVYDIELQSSDPFAPQPDDITVTLKPHQLAALHKMYIMEKYGKVYYNVADPGRYLSDPNMRRCTTIRGNFNIKSNVGILGDIVGYGKTLTALAIVALNNITPKVVGSAANSATVVSNSSNDMEIDSGNSNEIIENRPVTRSQHTNTAATVHNQTDSNKDTQIRGNIYREREMVYSYNSRNYSNFTATCEKTDNLEDNIYIRSTLIVVPRGPVYVQWENAIRNQTKLKVICIDSLPTVRRLCPASGSSASVIKAFFEKYDIVLVKNTALKTLMDNYVSPSYSEHPILAWDRIMIDEAHDIISKMPIFSFRFMWIISGTYQCIIHRAFGSRSQMSYAIRDLLSEERLNLILIKGESNFVKSSFNVPLPIEHSYLCSLPSNITALQPFLNANIREMINANDIKGAIREMGGTNETEEDIVDLVTREIQREINNKNREIQFYTDMDIPADQKEARILAINTDISRLNDRMNDLRERVSMLSEKTCPICYENFNSPIMLPCTHVFCGSCLLVWMRNGSNCPQCRAAINMRGLVAIVKEDEKTETEERPIILSKEETLMKLLNDKPNGRFLVFSRVDNGFWRLAHLLRDNNIPYSELKGSTPQMMRILERFRNGELRIILLNTYYAGSGIDISCATDLVLFHNMGIDAVQAIGRAQRVGRTDPLHIHTLMYSTEMN
jgi:SNF2 family DNA or RNA helicase